MILNWDHLAEENIPSQRDKNEFLVMDKIFVLDNFDFFLYKVVWAKLLSEQKDEA